MSFDLQSRLKSELYARYQLVPSDHWLNNFLSTIPNPAHPLPALASTAHFRLLSTDFTTSLSNARGQIFPQNITDVNTKESVLTVDIPVQILDIQDTSTSKWSQIEAIERVERGEEIRGREVIRNVPGASENDDDAITSEHDTASTALTARPAATVTASSSVAITRKGSTGPHRVLVQDMAGTKVWAFELQRIERITIVNSNPPVRSADGQMVPSPVEGMQIGCKMMLRKGVKVRRGMVMLRPDVVTMMGGKVEVWDEKWRQGMKERLKTELESERADG